MTQDLIGLTIHIAPAAGFESEILEAKSILWEGTQISEQFEAMLLNRCHQILHKQLRHSAFSVNEDEIRIEVVATYDEKDLEEWFAVGIELLHHKQNDEIIEQVSNSQFAETLCRELEYEIMIFLVRAASVSHLKVEVEVTSYAGMWS